MAPTRLTHVSGRMLPVRGEDIDTDRIIPARFLKTVTFDGLGDHVFEDERAAAKTRGEVHPVDNPAYAGATVMVVGRNFGCGSSREHAPQAIQRAGVRAVLGESFSGIFFGNALAIGLPCVAANADEIARLQAVAERSPEIELSLDIANRRGAIGDHGFALDIPDAAHEALVTGAWDATGLLLDAFDAVRAAAGRLPYVTGF